MHYTAWTGAEIRRLREHLGVSQYGLARLLHCRQATVSGWETENREVSRPYLQLLTFLANERGFWMGISGSPESRYQVASRPLLRIAEQ
jgi:transcriptional regulator with XRE-family HTH domain